MLSWVPSTFRVGGTHDKFTGDEVDVAGTTLIANAGSDLVALPSLTLMTIFEYVPVWDEAGVPVRLPEALLNVAQAGFLAILNMSVSPLRSDAVGWNA